MPDRTAMAAHVRAERTLRVTKMAGIERASAWPSGPTGLDRRPWAPRGLASTVWWLVVFGVTWLVLLGVLSRTPPQDVIEQLVWARSPQWGYYKHPPLPTWLLIAAGTVLPQGVELARALGALCLLGSNLIWWMVLRRMFAPRVAAILLLASLCITFYSVRLDYFNHNAVMMVWMSISAALAWQLVERPSWLVWLGLGICMGLGMLSKYQMVLAGLALALWWCRLSGWRHPVHLWGAVAAALVALLLLAPNLAWLRAHDWASLHYAEGSLGMGLSLERRALGVTHWLLDLVGLRMLPAWLVLAAALMAGARARQDQGAGVTAPQQALALRRDFWLIWGLVPVLAMSVIGLVAGSELQKHWGTAFACWLLPVVVVLVPGAARLLDRRSAWRAACLVFVAVQLVGALQLWATSPWGVPARQKPQWRDLPSAEMARTLDAGARPLLGGPIQVLSGDYRMAGALALHLPGEPKVMIFGYPPASPWVSTEDLAQGRTVEIFPTLSLPEGAQWLGQGWAWRVGVSELSQLSMFDWRRQQEQLQRRPQVGSKTP